MYKIHNNYYKPRVNSSAYKQFRLITTEMKIAYLSNRKPNMRKVRLIFLKMLIIDTEK